MASWGRRDGDALTGNVAIANNATALEGLTGATFLTELEIGTFVTVGAQEFKVTAVLDANSATVTPSSDLTVTNSAATVNDKPKWLDEADAADTINVSVAEAQDANNRVDGIKSPGWVKHDTYTSGPGGSITRKKTEILVAMKDPN